MLYCIVVYLIGLVCYNAGLIREGSNSHTLTVFEFLGASGEIVKATGNARE